MFSDPDMLEFSTITIYHIANARPDDDKLVAELRKLENKSSPLAAFTSTIALAVVYWLQVCYYPFF